MSSTLPNYVSCPDFSFKLQVLSSVCSYGLSTWISDKGLKFNMFKQSFPQNIYPLHKILYGHHYVVALA